MNHRPNTTRRRMVQAAALPLVWLAPRTRAQAGRIRLVIPFSAGATSDLLARPIMDALARELGQEIVIDNKPGAGGLTGGAEVARAAPDGLTLAWGTVSNHAIAPSLYPNPPYDPLRDFTPIALLCSVPHVVMVNPAVPAQTLAELVALHRRQPPHRRPAPSSHCSTPPRWPHHRQLAHPRRRRCHRPRHRPLLPLPTWQNRRRPLRPPSRRPQRRPSS